MNIWIKTKEINEDKLKDANGGISGDIIKKILNDKKENVSIILREIFINNKNEQKK